MKLKLIAAVFLCSQALAQIYYPPVQNPEFEDGTNSWKLSGLGAIVDHIPMGRRAPPDPSEGLYVGLLGYGDSTIEQYVPYKAGVTNRFIIRHRQAHNTNSAAFAVVWQAFPPSREIIRTNVMNTGSAPATYYFDVVPKEQLSNLARIVCFGDCKIILSVNRVEPPKPATEYCIAVKTNMWRKSGKATVSENGNVNFGLTLGGVVQTVDFMPGITNHVSINAKSTIVSPRWLTLEFWPSDHSGYFRKQFSTPFGPDVVGNTDIAIPPMESTVTTGELSLKGDNADAIFQTVAP